MKFNLRTYIVDSRIIQELESEHEDITTKIFRNVLDTGEHQLQQALIKLGWTPPKKERERNEQYYTIREF